MPSGHNRAQHDRINTVVKYIEYKENVMDAVHEHVSKDNVKPFIIVGLLNSLPFRFYVVIYDYAFAFESFTACLDMLFKAHFVLNVKYRPSVKSIFMFLQHYVYQIYTEYDIKVNKVSKFIGNIDKSRLPSAHGM